jgi:hypothetical protein
VTFRDHLDSTAITRPKELQAVTGTTTFLVGFYNSGVVSVLAGTLSLSGGGTVEGTFNASAGTAIDWSSGAFSYGTVTVLNGPGTIQMTSGSLTLVSNVITNLGVVGGTRPPPLDMG